MNKSFRIITRAVAGLVLSILMTVGTNGFAVSMSANAIAQSTPDPCQIQPDAATPIASPIVAVEPFDLFYIDRAIEGHSAAIVVASIGLQRAIDADVRRMALRVAESQAGEIQLLRSWKSAWYPDVLDSSTSPSDRRQHRGEAAVARLEPSSISHFSKR